ncbi:MAG: glycosyltransferase [Acidobacteriia bacterium]|nr:glycosyltransferase [Terriglobia bacterium]
MRLLVLYQARDAAKDHPGYFAGFERLVAEGVLSSHTAIPYYGVAEARGWDALWSEAYQAARQIEADAIFLQFFHGPIPDPAEGIQRLQRLPGKPLVFTSLGDPFGRWTKRVGPCFEAASSLAAVTFLTGMGYLARQLERRGSKNLVLMPHGCCQVRFGAQTEPVASHPDFDAVFVGSRLRSRNPSSHFFWVARHRAEFVAAFTKRYGRRFGLFGNGWSGNASWQGPVPFLEQEATYRRSAVVLGGMPNATHDYYLSDRPFIAAASGVPLVDRWVRGVDRILTHERDWWLAPDIDGMIRCCDRLLEMPQSDRLAVAAQTRERILASHTQYHRCREMVEIVSNLRQKRQRGERAQAPALSFLSPGPAFAVPPAIVNWQG